MLLENKIAIVSGGASGIGTSIAEKMIEEGATVIIGDFNEAAGAAAAEKLGEKCEFVKLDVSKENDWQNIQKYVVDKYQKLDVLVNCAGITGGALDVEHEDMDDWNKVFGVNAVGTFLGCKYAMQNMANGGSIVNINSMAAIFAEPVAVAYCASKGACRMITKSAALYGAKKSPAIRVNAVNPGSTRTPMLDEICRLQPEVMNAQKKKLPLGDFAEPEDIANMVVYLASDKAKYITGGDFLVDGGISAGF